MGVIEDVRKVVQDLVAPDLKAIQAQLKAFDESSKLRDDANAQASEQRDVANAQASEQRDVANAHASELRDVANAQASELRDEAHAQASELRDAALLGHIDRMATESKLRDDALMQKMDLKFESINAKIDANHATLINALNLDKRVEAMEKKTAATM